MQGFGFSFLLTPGEKAEVSSRVFGYFPSYVTWFLKLIILRKMNDKISVGFFPFVSSQQSFGVLEKDSRFPFWIKAYFFGQSEAEDEENDEDNNIPGRKTGDSDIVCS